VAEATEKSEAVNLEICAWKSAPVSVYSGIGSARTFHARHEMLTARRAGILPA